MTELELTRTRGDRRLYALEGIGTLRLDGTFARSATAEAGRDTWRFTQRGFWRRVIQATDAAGTVVGEFLPRDIRRGGTLRWGRRELTLQPISPSRERYILTERDRDLVLIDGKSWGRRPVKVTLSDSAAIEPGLLLFATFVVRQLAVNAANNSSASTTATMSGRAPTPADRPMRTRSMPPNLRIGFSRQPAGSHDPVSPVSPCHQTVPSLVHLGDSDPQAPVGSWAGA